MIRTKGEDEFDADFVARDGEIGAESGHKFDRDSLETPTGFSGSGFG